MEKMKLELGFVKGGGVNGEQQIGMQGKGRVEGGR